MCFHPIDFFKKNQHEKKIARRWPLTMKNHLLIQFVKIICRLKHLAMHS
jgi:hypothetical protein